MNDITSFFTTFVGILLNGVSWCFNTLDSIIFMGFSLLDFIIALFLLSVAFPLLINIVKSRGNASDRHIDRKGDSNEK